MREPAALLTFRAQRAGCAGPACSNAGYTPFHYFLSPLFHRAAIAAGDRLRFGRPCVMLNSKTSTPSTASVSTPVASLSPTPPPGQGELLLVVDDQENIRTLLDTVLTGHGYRTVLAVDGGDALAVFKQQSAGIAAVISDLHMPHTEGRSLADLLRQIRPEIPILFMSGLDEPASRREATPVSSKDPFLLKPFRPVALLEAIHRLLHSIPKN